MPELQYIEVGNLFPHPDNPRKEIGDVSELAESIKQNGIFQNLTVVPGHAVSDDEWREMCQQYRKAPSADLQDQMNSRKSSEGYTVIIGHRRLAAAKAAGLEKVPCVVADMTPKEQLQTMLLENMQRSDLTVYEQAQGFQLMLDMGSTVEEIAEKSGFSQTTVRRRVKMMELDQEKLKEVSKRQLSLADFDKLAQIEDIKVRNQCLDKIGTHDFNQSVTWELKRQATKKKLPAARKQLKKLGAKELQNSETWGSTYDSISEYIYLVDWEESTPFWCYIGPSVGGVIDHGAVFPGSREEALKAAGDAIGKLPPVKTLLVPGERLAAAMQKVKEPGNALSAAREQVMDLARKRTKDHKEGAGMNA